MFCIYYFVFVSSQYSQKQLTHPILLVIIMIAIETKCNSYLIPGFPSYMSTDMTCYFQYLIFLEKTMCL